MKNYFKLIAGFILITFFFSCSKEDINQDDDVLGVWETTVSENTHTLVFGENNTGLSIETNTNGSEITSSAVPFSWLANNKEIMLIDDNELQSSYVINAEGELVLDTSNVRFLKVSNDYSKYY